MIVSCQLFFLRSFKSSLTIWAKFGDVSYPLERCRVEHVKGVATDEANEVAGFGPHIAQCFCRSRENEICLSWGFWRLASSCLSARCEWLQIHLEELVAVEVIGATKTYILFWVVLQFSHLTSFQIWETGTKNHRLICKSVPGSSKYDEIKCRFFLWPFRKSQGENSIVPAYLARGIFDTKSLPAILEHKMKFQVIFASHTWSSQRQTDELDEYLAFSIEHFRLQT